MKISPLMLRQGLSEYIYFPEDCLESADFNLSPPRFYENSQILMPHRIYICRTIPAELNYLPEGSVLFYQSSDKVYSYKSNIFPIPDSLNADDVFNIILEIFEDFYRWDQDLRKAMEKPEPLEALLTCGCRFIGNPIFLHTHTLHPFAGIHPDASEQQNFLNSTTSSLIASMIRLPEFHRLDERPGHFFIPATLTEQAYHGFNVTSDTGDYSYRILMTDICRPFTPADTSLYLHLCRYIYRTMQQPGQQMRLFAADDPLKELRTVLRQMLDSVLPESPEQLKKLTESGWLPGHDYCALVTRLPQTNRSRHTVDLIIRQFQFLIPHSCAMDYQNSVVVVLNLSLSGESPRNLIRNCVLFLRDNFLKTGISDISKGFSDLPSLYIQGRLALDSISSANSYKWQIFFQDIALSYILDHCTGALDPELVANRKLKEVLAYDSLHNTEFYQTLKQYISCHFNALETTRQLFIHRSTFLYRLERLKTLFQIDLDDPDELLHIMISMRLLERE